jgi:hypothetical protein
MSAFRFRLFSHFPGSDLVTTLAGSGQASPSTDGTGLAATISGPYGIAADGSRGVGSGGAGGGARVYVSEARFGGSGVSQSLALEQGWMFAIMTHL